MPVLLDTNICIAYLNRSSATIQKKLEELSPEEVFVSAISIAELRFGAEKSQRREANHRVLDLLISTTNMIQFDDVSATAYGELRVRLEKMGRPIGPLDTLIAAQALAFDMVLITRNEKEFRQVPSLQIESWN